MFKNSYQNGLLSIFYSCGANPLAIWDIEVNNGHIKRLTDSEVNSVVLEIMSNNVATTYITCPPKINQVLGIKLPFLVMIIKNLKRYFSFEITILDDKNMRRRFRISNFQSTTKIKPFCTSMPIGLASGWNQIQFNLADFTRRAYGSQFVETVRVQVHANVRLRRIYFCEKLFSEDELPQDYKLYLPLERKKKTEEKKPEASKPTSKVPLTKAGKKSAPALPPPAAEGAAPPAQEAPSAEPPAPPGDEKVTPGAETEAGAEGEGGEQPATKDADTEEQAPGDKDETAAKEEGDGGPAAEDVDKPAPEDADKPATEDADKPAPEEEPPPAAEKAE